MKNGAVQNQPVQPLNLGGARVLLLAEFDDPAVRALLADVESRAAAPAATVLHAGLKTVPVIPDAEPWNTYTLPR